MADIRTLKLALLADTKDFIQGLDKADKESRSFSDKLGGALKTGALAFAALGAAAGAAAITIGVQAVKAAIEDEKAQLSLAQTLKNTTKATKDQIKGVEDYINKTALAKGVTDDQLRPSLDRLVRSTQDVTKAQKLQQLALDIAAGTGKDLATVTEALGKAYDGNLGALKRIGVPLDENIVKTKDFDAATKALSETFAGQADAAAETFAGRMARIKIAIDEAKEQLGQALLPLLERFANFATQQLAPALQGLVDGLTGKKKSVVPSFIMFKDATVSSEDAAYGLGQAIREMGIQLGAFNIGINETNSKTGLVGLIENLTALLDIINKILLPFQKLVEFSQQFAQSESQRRIELPSLIPETTNPNSVFNKPAAAVVNIYNNVKGAIDPQSTARTITKVQNTALKTTGIKPFNFGFR
jgi:hypothetical protein